MRQRGHEDREDEERRDEERTQRWREQLKLGKVTIQTQQDSALGRRSPSHQQGGDWGVSSQLY